MKIFSFVSALVLTLISFSVIAAEISSNQYLAASERFFENSKKAMWDMVQKNQMSLQEYNDTILLHNYRIAEYVKEVKNSEQSKKITKAIIDKNNELIKKLKAKQKQNLNNDFSSAGSDIALECSDISFKKDLPGVKGATVHSKVPTLDALAVSNVCQNKFSSQNYDNSIK